MWNLWVLTGGHCQLSFPKKGFWEYYVNNTTYSAKIFKNTSVSYSIYRFNIPHNDATAKYGYKNI